VLNEERMIAIILKGYKFNFLVLQMCFLASRQLLTMAYLYD